MSMARAPISCKGCAIVVSGIRNRAASGTLSNPMTEMSSGTRNPRDSATSITLIADRSFAAKIAVGRLSAGSVRIFRVGLIDRSG